MRDYKSPNGKLDITLNEEREIYYQNIKDHTELNFVPENINIQSMIKRNKKKLNSNKIKITEAKYELPRIIPLSKMALKKMSERISITDEIDSLPPDNSIVELEEKGKALKKLRDIQIEDSKKISNKIKIITIENLANILGNLVNRTIGMLNKYNNGKTYKKT